MMKKGNIPFGKADLAAIVLVSVQMKWQNQYNLTHLLTVPELTRALLPDLEAIKWVMVEYQNEAQGEGEGCYSPARSQE